MIDWIKCLIYGHEWDHYRTDECRGINSRRDEWYYERWHLSYCPECRRNKKNLVERSTWDERPEDFHEMGER